MIELIVRAHKIEGQKNGQKTHSLFCDRIQVNCDAVTSKMMINHYFVDRFFVFALFREPSFVEFDEFDEGGLTKYCANTKIPYNTCVFFLANSL